MTNTNINANCNFCHFCESCNSCNSCESCHYCNSCNSCNSCDFCHFCKNLKMTEKNIFCYSEKYNDESSFQQKRFRAFNKDVGEVRYSKICVLVKGIIPNNNKLELHDFWKSLTQEQWQKLLQIPEAKDFKKGFEFISGCKIDDFKSDNTIELNEKEWKLVEEV